MKTEAIITNIQKFSVHDGPGIRSLVFSKGCPLRCQWCANPENIAPQPQLMTYPKKCIGCALCVKACPHGALAQENGCIRSHPALCQNCGDCAVACPTEARILKGAAMSAEDVEQVIDRDLPFYRNSGGGVTFSGGEPLLHPDFICAIAQKYREKGLNTAVETCGHVPWDTFEQVLPWVDLFLYDLKMIDSEKHRQYCGAGNELILSNLEKLCARAPVTIRIPCIPGINDSAEDIRAAAEFIKTLSHVEAIHCLPYHNMGLSKYDALGLPYALSHIAPPGGAYSEHIRAMFAQYGLQIQIGG